MNQDPQTQHWGWFNVWLKAHILFGQPQTILCSRVIKSDTAAYLIKTLLLWLFKEYFDIL